MNFWDFCDRHAYGMFALALIALLWLPFCFSAPGPPSERQRP